MDTACIQLQNADLMPPQADECTYSLYDHLDICKDILFGIAIGDALGVPVEFKSRKSIAENPVTDMIGYGTYDLPLGTFSDDSSLSFCLAEALTRDFSLTKIADNFIHV